jgi:phosphatidylserine/phosphatidylglycerophosphate/cardiolipin synthase-like enzyme
MKFVVLRHARRPERDVAFVGGIDLCHSRRDDAEHLGDPQRQPMAAIYGDRPPWHDLQAMIQGPAVGDVEAVFRERWEDPAPLSKNPLHWLRDLSTGLDRRPPPLPPQRPDPVPRGSYAVQLLRTYPYRRSGYAFAPDGERSIARGYLKALPRARSLIYLEDQYLWSTEIVTVLAEALRANPGLRLIAVLPRFPDQDGKLSMSPNLVGRAQALALLRAAGQDRVAIYGLENAAGTPIYVHAKVCVVDDTWAIVGSDNFNRRSWTHDSELSCAIVDLAGPAGQEPESGAAGDARIADSAHAADATRAGSGRRPGLRTRAEPAGVLGGQRTFAGQLRLALAAEHLGGGIGSASLTGPAMFDAFRRSATALDTWHQAGRRGARPPGQLRHYPDLRLSGWTRTWAALPYRLVYDPDGRPRAMRRSRSF